MARPKGSRNKPKAAPVEEMLAAVAEAEAEKSALYDPPKVYSAGLNGTLPRSQRNCANCDASRLVGTELRCWVEPPVPQVAGWLPPLGEGGVGRPIVLALQRPTFPEYVCPRWVQMAADHPDFGMPAGVSGDPPVEEPRH